MPAVTDYLLRPAAGVVAGVWVRLVNNVTGIAYTSTAAADPNGLFPINAPAGLYTVYTAPTASGPTWTPTGSTSYAVAPTNLGFVSAQDYGVSAASADNTVAFAAWIAALPLLGGLGVCAPGAYKGSIVISPNTRIKLEMTGVTLQPLTGTTGLTYLQSVGATAPGSQVYGLVIDGQNLASVVGAMVRDTDRAALRHVRIVNCTTGLLIQSFTAALWAENGSLDDVFIFNCGTGMVFQVVSGNGSFGEWEFREVGISNCAVGIDCLSSAVNLYRSYWRNVVVWIPTNGIGMRLNGNITAASFDIAFENLAGAATNITGLLLQPGVVNAPLATFNLSFTGVFATQVSDPSSLLPIWKLGTRQFWVSGNQTSFEHWQAGDTNPRVTIGGQFAGGGGLKFGPGGATLPDTTLYRSAASTLKTDGTFIAAAVGKTALQLLDAGGGMTLGGDTTVYRVGAAWLKTDGQFSAGAAIQSGGTGKTAFFDTDTSGLTGMTLGADTTIYRLSAAVLATDGGFRILAGQGVDTIAAGSLAIGAATATSVLVGRSGQSLGFYGVAAVVKAGAIATPNTQTGSYVQADVQSLKTAIDAIRVALTNIGITA